VDEPLVFISDKNAHLAKLDCALEINSGDKPRQPQANCNIVYAGYTAQGNYANNVECCSWPERYSVSVAGRKRIPTPSLRIKT
jgi:hypothetical protein